ncbi:RnfH family protein [Bordetella genomosp. 13]|uniref:RnfH family protein n=1 Tax=Bordetella genomosp. 13 TaxID=463040 RepID=UPI0011AA4826|nr:RnfH family protein [Bordetella genomosp. 13]
MASDAHGGPLRVQVCHAAAAGAWLRDLAMPAGATAADALAASGFAQAFPDVDPWRHGVGIYGRACHPGAALADGDRLEIYRELTFDPKESRRRRVEHRRAREARQGRERPAGLL